MLTSLRATARQHWALRTLYGKAWAAVHYQRAMRRQPRAALRFLLTDPEIENYTYPIAKSASLAEFLHATLAIPRDQAAIYLTELAQDEAFRAELAVRLRGRRHRKPHAYYGRRAGWYAVVRATRPALVVETGVHDGLGSAVLCAPWPAIAREEHQAG